MRQLLSLFAFFILAATASAQTKMIAFKSHAGDMDFFVPDAQPEDDFGLPPSRMTRIVKINDSTVVEHAKEYGSTTEMTDTVVNHIYCNNPKIGLDSLKKLYPKDIIFEGFDNKVIIPKENPTKTTTEENKDLKKETKAQKKKKKKEQERADAVGFIQPNSGNSGGGNIALFVFMAIGYGLVLSAILFWLKPNKTQVA